MTLEPFKLNNSLEINKNEDINLNEDLLNEHESYIDDEQQQPFSGCFL